MTTPRQLIGHIVNPVNDKLTIAVMDEPGSGGASHHYVIRGYDIGTNSSVSSEPGRPEDQTEVLFQNGPIQEKGVNGITQEALLEIVIDRLRSFQKGPFTSRENAIALTHIEEAQMWLQSRTRERIRRGVEGMSVK